VLSEHHVCRGQIRARTVGWVAHRCGPAKGTGVFPMFSYMTYPKSLAQCSLNKNKDSTRQPLRSPPSTPLNSPPQTPSSPPHPLTPPHLTGQEHVGGGALTGLPGATHRGLTLPLINLLLCDWGWGWGWGWWVLVLVSVPFGCEGLIHCYRKPAAQQRANIHTQHTQHM